MSAQNLRGRSRVATPIRRLRTRVESSGGLFTEMLPNPGYEMGSGGGSDCGAFVNTETYQFTTDLAAPSSPAVPAVMTAISNCALSIANSPAVVPGASSSVDALRVQITNTALPAVVRVYATGTSGFAVRPCSRYRFSFSNMYGPAEGNATYWQIEVDQYDASGAQVSGGTPIAPTNSTGTSGWGYAGPQANVDTEPNAAYVSLRVSFTGRTADHSIFLSSYISVPQTCYSRYWNLVDDSTAAADLESDYAADDLGLSATNIAYPSGSASTCTSLPYEGSWTGAGAPSTDGAFYPYLAYGPVDDIVPGTDYRARWAWGGIYDAIVNQRTAVLWLDSSWAALSVDIEAVDGIDNTDGCWVPASATFTAPASAEHALLLVSAAYPTFFEVASDYDGTSFGSLG